MRFIARVGGPGDERVTLLSSGRDPVTLLSSGRDPKDVSCRLEARELRVRRLADDPGVWLVCGRQSSAMLASILASSYQSQS